MASILQCMHTHARACHCAAVHRSNLGATVLNSTFGHRLAVQVDDPATMGPGNSHIVAMYSKDSWRPASTDGPTVCSILGSACAYAVDADRFKARSWASVNTGSMGTLSADGRSLRDRCPLFMERGTLFVSAPTAHPKRAHHLAVSQGRNPRVAPAFQQP